MSVSLPKSVRIAAASAALLTAVLAVPAAAHGSAAPSSTPTAHLLAGPIKLS